MGTGATMGCRWQNKILENTIRIGGTDVRSKQGTRKTLVREEVWNEGRRETIRELLAPEAVIQEGNDASVYWS